MRFALVLCLAVLADGILGDPRNFPHPVRLIGHVITFWHGAFFNGTGSFVRGLAVVVMTLMTAGLLVAGTLCVSGCSVVVQVYLLYSAVAWRDLKDETRPVYLALLSNDLPNARKYLAFVVGRDTENLSETEIVRAVIETVAENSVDGVMSVLFFAAMGNVIGGEYGACVSVWLFKSASTLDSMLGYESYGRYGTPSARLDDILNFIPARLGGLLIVMAGALTGGNFREGWRVFVSDRLRHKSPNSAHGESAFAGVLGVRLGGGACYGGKFEARAWLNESARDPEAGDIVRAWRVLDGACVMAVIFAAMIH